ncbi:tetratricopeptide repeat protein [Clostridium butyricum]
MLEDGNARVEDFEENVNYSGKICERCGAKYIDVSESRYSILCTECRENQIKYPIPKIFLLLGIALSVLVIIALVQFPKSFKDYAVYKTAEEKANDGYANETLLSLEGVIGKHPETTDIAVTAVDIAMENGNYAYAGYLLDKYLIGKKVSDTVYYRLDGYLNKIDSIYNVYDEYENIVSNIDTNLSEDQAVLQAKSDVSKLLYDGKYNKAVVYNYLALLTDDAEEHKEYLKKSIEEDSKVLETQVQLANAYRREGNSDEAKSMLDKVLIKERHNIGAKRGLAILNMVEGNYSEAVELARFAYEKSKEYPYVYETLAIALFFDGQVEESNKIIEEFKAAGNELEEDTKMLLNGQLTLNQYYQG